MDDRWILLSYLPAYVTLAGELWLAYRRPAWLAQWAYVDIPLAHATLSLPEGSRTTDAGYREGARRPLEVGDVVDSLALAGNGARGVWRGQRGVLRNSAWSFVASQLFVVVRLDAGPSTEGRAPLRARAWPVGSATAVACVPAVVAMAFAFGAEMIPIVVLFWGLYGVVWRWRLRRGLPATIEAALAPLRAALRKAREESRLTPAGGDGPPPDVPQR